MDAHDRADSARRSELLREELTASQSLPSAQSSGPASRLLGGNRRCHCRRSVAGPRLLVSDFSVLRSYRLKLNFQSSSTGMLVPPIVTGNDQRDSGDPRHNARRRVRSNPVLHALQMPAASRGIATHHRLAANSPCRLSRCGNPSTPRSKYVAACHGGQIRPPRRPLQRQNVPRAPSEGSVFAPISANV